MLLLVDTKVDVQPEFIVIYVIALLWCRCWCSFRPVHSLGLHWQCSTGRPQ